MSDLPAPPAPVAAARYSREDYRRAAQALLPRGRIWPTARDSVQAGVFDALAATLERLDASGCVILNGSLPGSPVSAFLPEWEAALGLPDPCAGENPTFEQRFEQVRARFIGGGGQSRDRFIAFAAALGFEITITYFSPFRVGFSRIGDPLASSAWSFAWGIRVIANSGDFPPELLLCELEAIKPAGTTIILL